MTAIALQFSKPTPAALDLTASKLPNRERPADIDKK
jgi:hypothetical protein